MVFLLGPDDGKGFICGERRSDCERYPSDSNPGHDIKLVPFSYLMCYRREKFRMRDSGLYIDIEPAFCRMRRSAIAFMGIHQGSFLIPHRNPIMLTAR